MCISCTSRPESTYSDDMSKWVVLLQSGPDIMLIVIVLRLWEPQETLNGRNYSFWAPVHPEFSRGKSTSPSFLPPSKCLFKTGLVIDCPKERISPSRFTDTKKGQDALCRKPLILVHFCTLAGESYLALIWQAEGFYMSLSLRDTFEHGYL